MAYQSRNLSVIAYANGFTMWHYAGGESLAAISAKGFFDQASCLMNTGDIIIVNGRNATGLRKITATFPLVTVAKA